MKQRTARDFWAAFVGVLTGAVVVAAFSDNTTAREAADISFGAALALGLLWWNHAA